MESSLGQNVENGESKKFCVIYYQEKSQNEILCKYIFDAVSVGSWQYLEDQMQMFCGEGNEIHLTAYLRDSLWSLQSKRIFTNLQFGIIIISFSASTTFWLKTNFEFCKGIANEYM